MKIFKNTIPVGDTYNLDLIEGPGHTLTVTDEPRSGATQITVSDSSFRTARVTMSVASDLDQTSTTFNDILQRLLILLPVTTTQWRLRVRNITFAGAPISGALTLTDTYCGAPTYSATGLFQGVFASAPTKVLNAPAPFPSDGSEWVSPWVTDPTQQFVKNTARVISTGFTCAASQNVVRGANVSYGACFFAAGSAAKVAQLDPATTVAYNAPFLDIRLEYEFFGPNKIVLVVGDSLSSNYISDTSLFPNAPGPHSPWIGQVGIRDSVCWINASVGGLAYSSYASGSYVLSRFDLATTVPDMAILACGSNEAATNVTSAQFKTNIQATITALQALGITRFAAATVMPRGVTQWKPAYLTAGATAGATTLQTSLAYANADVIDIDYGLTAYEQRIVSGASTGAGPFTTTVTVATSNVHPIGATVSLANDSRRQDYNAYLRTLPSPIKVLYDFDQVVRDQRNPIAMQPVFLGNAADGTHGGAALQATMAGQVPTIILP